MKPWGNICSKSMASPLKKQMMPLSMYYENKIFIQLYYVNNTIIISNQSYYTMTYFDYFLTNFFKSSKKKIHLITILLINYLIFLPFFISKFASNGIESNKKTRKHYCQKHVCIPEADRKPIFVWTTPPGLS